MLLALALDTDQMQNESMVKLSQQGGHLNESSFDSNCIEQLDRIENKLENIDANLDRADHLMKGIER